MLRRVVLFLSISICGLLYVDSAYADVCFLPTGGCVATGKTGGVDEDCSGYEANKKGQGWDCSDTCIAHGNTYYKCVMKSCGSKYTAGITSCERGYTHEYETDKNGKYVYSGDQKCGRCIVPDDCPDGTQLSSTCAREGYKTRETQYYKGQQVCYACLDDNCKGGQKKKCNWNTDWYNSKEWYLSTSRTQYGSTCYACCNNECPSGTSLQISCNTSTEQKRTHGKTACGYSCYYCCNDVCSKGSKTPCGSDEHPTSTITTDCGSTCYVGCVPNCSDTCRSGQKYVSCGTGYTKKNVSSTECGSKCYSCVTAGCSSGYSTSVTSCGSGEEKVCSGKSGESDCCRCRKPCSSLAETTDKSSKGYQCSECEMSNGSKGYECQCVKPTEKNGYCYDCSDEKDANRPCQGKYHCQGGGRTPEGSVTCTCEGYSYYNACIVIETCSTEADSNYYNGDYHNAYSFGVAGNCYSGYYSPGTKCTKVDGTVVRWCTECNADGKDILGGTPLAQGYKLCSGAGKGDSVKCGNKTYYKDCEECSTETDNHYYNGDYHNAYSFGVAGNCYSGYYSPGTKCTQENGTVIRWCTECNADGKDILGGTPPAQGLKECGAGEVGSPDTVCGGKHYGPKCVTYCNPNKTDDPNFPQYHCAAGQTFVFNCTDENGVRWGDCK